MKKMGILLITIMLFSMIGVFDFSEVRADVYFGKEDKNVWYYCDYNSGGDSVDGTLLYTTTGVSSHQLGKSGEYEKYDYVGQAFSSDFGTNAGYYYVKAICKGYNPANTTFTMIAYFEWKEYRCTVNWNSSQNKWTIKDSDGTVLGTSTGSTLTFDIEVSDTGFSLGGYTPSLYGDSTIAYGYKVTGGTSGYLEYWIDYIYESANTKDFNAYMEESGDPASSNNYVYFHADIQDDEGGVNGVTFSNMVLTKDGGNSENLDSSKWSQSLPSIEGYEVNWSEGDGQYFYTLPLTGLEGGTYTVSVTISKEGYNDHDLECTFNYNSGSGSHSGEEGITVQMSSDKQEYTGKEKPQITLIVNNGTSEDIHYTVHFSLVGPNGELGVENNDTSHDLHAGNHNTHTLEVRYGNGDGTYTMSAIVSVDGYGDLPASCSWTWSNAPEKDDVVPGGSAVKGAKKVWDKITDVPSWLKDKAGDVKDKVKDGAGWLKDKLGGVKDKVKDGWNWLKDKIGDKGGSFFNFLKGMGKYILLILALLVILALIK